MKKNILITSCAISALLVSGAQAVTLISSDFTGDHTGTSTSVTWTTDANVTELNSGTIAAVGDGFRNVGNPAAAVDLTNVISTSGNLSGVSPQGFSFDFSLSAGYDLTSLVVDTGHVNGQGLDQAYMSDLTISINGINGTVYSYSDEKMQVDYTSGARLLTQTFDLSSESLVAGDYRVTVSMDNLDEGGAFAEYDNFSLSGAAVAAVPEPSSASLIAVGGLTFGLRRRR
ncbi:PEP-CTERM sorting domain-containing protein [Rubritalea marina]|uniref:PEP-CTERM sorting domain-containing protein n=1 Tax=Rubritalea marina TaxID=361055 RepID=UPI000368004E|nr:PEP-CTERM sorting domain-containing protein [Rubritalea marina]